VGIRVAIVNHGLSNLNSIARAIEECGGTPVITDDPAEFGTADRIVLPGVGAFAAAIANLRAKGLDEALCSEVRRRSVPLLGICLGMQLLAERGSEGGDNTGLGLIPGRVVRLKPTADERVPHMGWNAVNPVGTSELFEDIPAGTDFYFVHSFCLSCPDEYVIARTPYCGEFVSAAGNGPVSAVQFHPEKSQKAGFQLLRNFLAV
jgi:glutamine amidotransferase